MSSLFWGQLPVVTAILSLAHLPSSHNVCSSDSLCHHCGETVFPSVICLLAPRVVARSFTSLYPRIASMRESSKETLEAISSYCTRTISSWYMNCAPLRTLYGSYIRYIWSYCRSESESDCNCSLSIVLTRTIFSAHSSMFLTMVIPSWYRIRAVTR